MFIGGSVRTILLKGGNAARVSPLPAPRTHDMMVADIDGDGRQELYVWNQDAKTLFTVRLPDDPYVTPWPGFRPIVTGVNEQSFAVADVDGDGKLELIAGRSWYRLLASGEWERHVYTEDFDGERVVAADFDGDGRPEIALCEVSADFGQTYGRLALLRPGADPEDLWEAEVLREQLVDAHSLQVADFDGDGRPDIYVGEMGRADWDRSAPASAPALSEPRGSHGGTRHRHRRRNARGAGSSNWTGASE